MMVKDELKNCFTVERALTLFKTGKIQKIVYWVFNLLLAWELAFGASWDLLRIQYVQDVMVHLGYPVYILTIIGVWKVGAAIAILIPRFPILKEWAYAGVIFLFTGRRRISFRCRRQRWRMDRFPDRDIDYFSFLDLATCNTSCDSSLVTVSV